VFRFADGGEISPGSLVFVLLSVMKNENKNEESSQL
jgi:hypothetical protein